MRCYINKAYRKKYQSILGNEMEHKMWSGRSLRGHSLNCVLPMPPAVERFYCKRPIQYLASSEILIPNPSSPGECVSPRLWCGKRTHSLGGEGVGGQ
jgi:hypothetical protein